ncbi:helix-turn-helix domain-containing protein [Sulfitobacter sp. OXR-159]|uniref:helix-turn-helix domain-containing protein n=1 Tax=Sulfitobacter sp. OXR-159 TaxID=3100174 RepID=UPI0039FC76AD
MSRFLPTNMDYDEMPLEDLEASEGKDDADLWFLPGPIEDEPDYLPPGPTPEAKESDVVDAWRAAEAGQAAQLARVSARLGILDERLRRGPAGWRQRLALIEASDLSWITQDRIGLDRLSLYMALRVSTATDDAQALYRIGWTVRRLTGGPAPLMRRSGVGDLETFLDRRDRPGHGERFEDTNAPSRVVEMAEREAFEDRAAGWLAMMNQAENLHPVTRACMGFHLWHVAELSPIDDPLEAAVTASRVAITELAPSGSMPGAIFAPIAMGGGGGFRAIGDPPARLARWLNAMESATFAALRRLEEIEAWAAAAERAMAPLSGKTPPMLRNLFASWPLVSVQMAEKLTGTHRATVQRNIDWMDEQGLIREVTGQGRYRMWRIVEPRSTEANSMPERHDELLAEDFFDVLVARQ